MYGRLLRFVPLLAGLAGPAMAATLNVGPGQPYAEPSEAIAAARPGDTVRIAPGQYFDCAVVRQNGLTIEGTGEGAVLTDKTCEGKALLVTDGDDITIRNLTLQRARVADQNGAGIRAEGGNLTVESVRFLNDENGILTAPAPKATLRVLDSTFIGDGRCRRSCAHAIYAARIALLDVENSRFLETHDGHDIKSRALETRVVNCDIADGVDGTSSYLIDIPNGGGLLVEGNRMEKGPKSQNHGNAIIIGEEGVTQPTTAIIARNNVFTNDTGFPTIFVHNITATPADLSGNVFKGGPVRPLEGDGSTS